MAPTPNEDIPKGELSASSSPRKGYWTTANIAFTTVFALLFLAIFLALLLLLLSRRSQKKKLENRKSDKAGLLANEDKTSMFSRQRESSVTLYVGHDGDANNKRASVDTLSLVPLQVTPAEESRDPIEATSNENDSSGSGVSALSRTSNTNTMSTMLLSPVLGPTTPNVEDGDLGVRPSGRPRSTSSASQRARYYESTPTNVEIPPIPTIIRTPSD